MHSPKVLLATALLTTAAFAAFAADAPAPAAAAPAATPAAASPVADKPLEIGATAPALKGINQDGKVIDLAELYKKGPVLVYFYPKAGTPGCTAEACSLRDATPDFTATNLTIIGVSHDSVEAQKKFAIDQKLTFSLLADPKGDIYKAFGVPGFNRQSYLVQNGKIVWRQLAASTDKQADDVKKAMADLKISLTPPTAPAKP
jgi:peroxiredoxin Q/BCP